MAFDVCKLFVTLLMHAGFNQVKREIIGRCQKSQYFLVFLVYYDDFNISLWLFVVEVSLFEEKLLRLSIPSFCRILQKYLLKIPNSLLSYEITVFS